MEDFIVGRYESGLDVDFGSASQTTANATYRNLENKTPIIVEGAIPWNCIDYNKSKANSEAMYSNNGVQSGLITGTQWDTIMKFYIVAGGKTMADIQTDSESFGNYNNTSKSLNRYAWISTNYGASWTAGNFTATSTAQLIRTGASTETKVLNISNMAGNIWEWTNEMFSGDRVGRGGYFYYSSSDRPVAFRGKTGATGAYDDRGFRVTLYVK